MKKSKVFARKFSNLHHPLIQPAPNKTLHCNEFYSHSQVNTQFIISLFCTVVLSYFQSKNSSIFQFHLSLEIIIEFVISIFAHKKRWNLSFSRSHKIATRHHTNDLRPTKAHVKLNFKKYFFHASRVLEKLEWEFVSISNAFQASFNSQKDWKIHEIRFNSIKLKFKNINKFHIESKHEEIKIHI